MLRFIKKKGKVSLYGFDEQSYLEANTDVYEALKENRIASGREHLERYGLDEIRQGKRKFHSSFQTFDEVQYLNLCSDVREAVSKGAFQSGFEHFCSHGYNEIISGKREWPRVKKSIALVEDLTMFPNGIYGHIEKLHGRSIEGWAGADAKELCNVNILLDGEYIGTVTPTIERPDVSLAGQYTNGKGFEIEIPIEMIRTFLEQKNIPENIMLQLEMENILLPKKYHFSTQEWLHEVALEVSGDDFLYYVPLIGKGIERFFSFGQIVEILKKLEIYKLDNALKNEKEVLLSLLLHLHTISEDEKQGFIHYLSIHQDILLRLAELLKDTQNKALTEIVNRVLNSINPLDAWQILQHSGSMDLFDTYAIERKLEDDRQIAYLANHPDEIIPAWQKLEKRERKEKMFSFLGLFVFLQEYDKLRELEIDPAEILPDDKKLELEEIQDWFLKKNRAWESLLVTLYLLSLGVSRKTRNRLVKNFVLKLDTFEYVNTSALYWIVQTKVDASEDFGLLQEIMQMLHPIFDKKSLWHDSFVKKITMLYLHVLLKHRSENLFDTHKHYMYHYLLDSETALEQELLTEKYLDLESVLWLKKIEHLRQEAIRLIGDIEKVDKLIDILKTVEYLSPELVRKIKFEIYSNVLNLEDDRELTERAAYGMLQIGGEYDKFMAAAKLEDEDAYAYYEKRLVDNTKKEKHESKNNYWYKKALQTRMLEEDQKEAFIKALYTYIVDDTAVSEEQLRLMQLLLSELLLIVEENGNIGIDINEVIEKFVEINDAVFVYTQVWLYALKLFDEDEKGDSSLDYQEFFNEDLCYESREKIKEILKVHDNENMPLQDAKALMKQAMVFPYTLVMVYSCQAYMDTRQKAIRETWHQRAKDLKIPCVFVVGGSDISHMEGDVMYLAVEDTYEKLPQKSLEMFRFAYEQFAYERFLKIDDDCFLNVDAYFSDDVLFQSDFYGRKNLRSEGDTDRVWHQKKSLTQKAQNEIDLSPEPSIYADGSTGYMLSRFAINNLIMAANEPSMKSLISYSFMEDKLIGDLLSTRNINLVSTNFTSLVYRKLTEKIEATFWEYNIHPSLKNSIKVFHCELDESLYMAWEFYKGYYKEKQKKYFSNRPIINFESSGYSEQPFVESISIKQDAIRDAQIVAIMVCKNEKYHLDALLQHHRNIGVDHFIYIDNGSNDGSIELMLEQYDVSLFATTQAYKNSRFGVNWMEAVLSNFCYGKWILVIDADELFVFDDFEETKINRLTAYADANGYDAYLAPMVDMYSKCKIKDAHIEGNVPYKVCDFFDYLKTMNVSQKNTYGPFSNAGVFSGGLRARVFGEYNLAPTHSYLNQKFCLFKYKPTFRFVEGIHFMGNHNPAPIKVGLLHFKYHSRFFSKVQEQIKSGQHWNGSQEYKRYLSKLEHTPDLSLYDTNISLKYKSSVSLIEAGYMDKLQ